MPVKSGVATGLWWFDQVKSDTLDQVMADSGSEPTDIGDEKPGWGMTLFWLLGGIIVLVILFRKTWPWG